MALIPTPSSNQNLALVLDGFPTITKALDYAAKGETGYNFYGLHGEVETVLPYSLLRENAQELAAKLSARFERGSRIALVAETGPDFMILFFACQYSGMIPAPMPMPVNLGGKEGYLVQIRQMIMGAKAAAAVAPSELTSFISEAAEGLADVEVFDYDSLKSLPSGDRFEPFGPDEDCYIQYSSGSTSAPKGVIGTQKSVTSNLQGITAYGLAIKENDRAACWLPLYHDMGLIGFVLAPLFGQVTVDYLATAAFVRRPLLWLRIMSENKTSITYSPSFGYELAAKRAARAESGSLDLSNIRVAGIGGDMVRADALNAFSDAFADAGFKASAFLPSYGLAEATLAISFTDLDAEVTIDHVDMRHYTRSGVAQPASAVTSPEHRRGFVLCGRALPGHEIEVRGEHKQALDPRVVGQVFIKGPSVTSGYFSDAQASERMFDGEWLDTGDMGYFLDGQIVITGRVKDLIIINGRNIWPQDIEWAVEKVDGVRQGGVAAFSIDDGAGEKIVVVAECRGMDDTARETLQQELSRVVRNASGAPAKIVLARPHSMVLTSSGKLSRAKVKQKFVDGAFDSESVDTPSAPALIEARV